eukprot:COSAG01_NODE_11951_length_1806_cov_39.342973_1_plen_168_part_00
MKLQRHDPPTTCTISLLQRCTYIIVWALRPRGRLPLQTQHYDQVIGRKELVFCGISDTSADMYSTTTFISTYRVTHKRPIFCFVNILVTDGHQHSLSRTVRVTVAFEPATTTHDVDGEVLVTTLLVTCTLSRLDGMEIPTLPVTPTSTEFPRIWTQLGTPFTCAPSF